MIVDELGVSSNFRLSRILKMLESIYGITVDFKSASNRAELRSIYEEYGLVRSTIVKETQFNSYNCNPEYVKACLIQEAIQIFLSEVAPKRLNRRKKNSA